MLASYGFGGRQTLALSLNESLVFLGVSGDFQKTRPEDLEKVLADEFHLHLVGRPARAFSNREHMIWGVRTSEPEKLVASLARPLKKRGFRVERLRVSGFTLFDATSGAVVQRSLREVERKEKKVWGGSIHPREKLVWIFHEARISSKKVKNLLQGAGLKLNFFHQELVLEAKEERHGKALAAEASARLDLVYAREREGRDLVLDVFLRDVDSFLALPRGKRFYPCPDLTPFLKKVPGGTLDWKVTFDNAGYPFAD
ncbi:MAG: hypothetical protein ACE5H3_08460 [Planctomycetota bacterium]